MDILDEIVAHKRIEVERLKQQLPPKVLYAQVEQMIDGDANGNIPSMVDALMASASGIISEFKRRSPSKGWIKEDGRADIIPLSYQQNGASALSILTDEKYFGGCDDFIRTARQSGVTIPILYKNFVVDEYQLFQARHCGASAVLLIAADLPLAECKMLMQKAHELGLDVLLEMHAEQELDYADMALALPTASKVMYGINNRNLGTFVTDVNNSFRMAERLPKDVCKVSESGISNVATIRQLREVGYRGFLIGECFMKTADPGLALQQFVSQLSLSNP